jgi:hypothetical protein
MRVFQQLFFGLGACFWLFAGSTGQALAEVKDLSLDQITAWLEGQYSNEQQVADGVLDAESNLLFPVFKRVDISAFGSHVIYLQWPIGSPEGRLQRQRIWTFAHEESGDGVRMNFFTLKKPEEWRDAHLAPAKVKTMTLEDTIGYPEGCLLPVTLTDGQISASIPATCEIVSQGTRTAMTLQSQITITEDQITYQEGGVRPDGTLVFQVPPAGRYVFKQLAD